jgi:hypothetical protein
MADEAEAVQHLIIITTMVVVAPAGTLVTVEPVVSITAKEIV